MIDWNSLTVGLSLGFATDSILNKRWGFAAIYATIALLNLAVIFTR